MIRSGTHQPHRVIACRYRVGIFFPHHHHSPRNVDSPNVWVNEASDFMCTLFLFVFNTTSHATALTLRQPREQGEKRNESEGNSIPHANDFFIAIFRQTPVQCRLPAGIAEGHATSVHTRTLGSTQQSVPSVLRAMAKILPFQQYIMHKKLFASKRY